MWYSTTHCCWQLEEWPLEERRTVDNTAAVRIKHTGMHPQNRAACFVTLHRKHLKFNTKKNKIKKFIDTMQDYNKADMVMCWQSLGTEGFKSHSSTGECSGCVLSHNKNEALLFDRNYLQKKRKGTSSVRMELLHNDGLSRKRVRNKKPVLHGRAWGSGQGARGVSEWAWWAVDWAWGGGDSGRRGAAGPSGRRPLVGRPCRAREALLRRGWWQLSLVCLVTNTVVRVLGCTTVFFLQVYQIYSKKRSRNLPTCCGSCL